MEGVVADLAFQVIQAGNPLEVIRAPAILVGEDLELPGFVVGKLAIGIESRDRHRRSVEVLRAHLGRRAQVAADDLGIEPRKAPLQGSVEDFLLAAQLRVVVDGGGEIVLTVRDQQQAPEQAGVVVLGDHRRQFVLLRLEIRQTEFKVVGRVEVNLCANGVGLHLGHVPIHLGVVLVRPVVDTRQADGQPIGHRCTEITFQAPAVVIAVLHPQLHLHLVGVRLLGDDADGTARGIAPEQSALRALQHFHALDAAEGLDHTVRRWHVDAIDIGGNAGIGRRHKGIGAHAAKIKQRVTRSAGVLEAWNQASDLGRILYAERLQRSTAVGLDRDRHILLGFFALLRRDEDFLHHAIGRATRHRLELRLFRRGLAALNRNDVEKLRGVGTLPSGAGGGILRGRGHGSR